MHSVHYRNSRADELTNVYCDLGSRNRTLISDRLASHARGLVVYSCLCFVL